MLHRHHLIPKHRGGSNEETNLTPPIHATRCENGWSSHCMYHFCEWQLWGLQEDYLAWRGLAGFLGKEEKIERLMDLGRQKAKPNREKAIKRKFESGEHPFLDPDFISKRRPSNVACMTRYNQSQVGRENSRKAVAETNKRRVECPYCDYVNNPGNLARHIKNKHPGKNPLENG